MTVIEENGFSKFKSERKLFAFHFMLMKWNAFPPPAISKIVRQTELSSLSRATSQEGKTEFKTWRMLLEESVAH